MTDIEGFLTICGHSDNLLNNKEIYTVKVQEEFDRTSVRAML